MAKKIFGLLIFLGMVILIGITGGADCNTIDFKTYCIGGAIGIGLMIIGLIGVGGFDFEK